MPRERVVRDRPVGNARRHLRRLEIDRGRARFLPEQSSDIRRCHPGRASAVAPIRSSASVGGKPEAEFVRIIPGAAAARSQSTLVGPAPRADLPATSRGTRDPLCPTAPSVLLATLARAPGQFRRQHRVVDDPADRLRSSLRVATRHEQAVDTISQDGGNAPGMGRDNRAAAGEGLQHRRWHVVDIRRLQVDVRVGVIAVDFRRRYSTGKPDLLKVELDCETA